MIDLGTLTAYINADIDGLLKGAKTATIRMQKLSRDVQKSTTAIGQSFTRVGRRVTMGLTLPVVGVGTAVLKMSGSFEKSMNKVQALSQASAGDFVRLEKQARDLGRTTQFTASQAADAMGFFALAGYNADQIMGALPSTLQLAAAAQIDLAEATDITTGILAGYRLRVDQLQGANDVLVKAFTSAKLNLSDLGQAFKMAGPIAKAAGLEFSETAAVLGILANAQIQGVQGGTAFRNMLVKLQGASKQGKEIMEKWGITVKDARGNMLPFTDILKQFERAQSQVNDSVQFGGDLMQIFGLRAGPAMQALLGQGSKAISDLQHKLDNAGGIAKRVADVQLRGFYGWLISLKSAIEGLALAISKSGLLQFATNLAKRATFLFRKLAKLNKQILFNATVIAGLIGIVGPLLIIFGLLITTIGWLIGTFAPLIGAVMSVISVFGFLLSPIGLVIAIVAGLAVAFVHFQDQIKTSSNFFAKAVRFLIAKAKDLKLLALAAEYIGKAWVGLKVTFFAVISSIQRLLARLAQGFGKILKGALIVANTFGSGLPPAVADAIVAFNGLSNSLDNLADNSMQRAVDVSSQWSMAFDSLKADMSTLKGVAGNAFDGLIDTIKGKLSALQSTMTTALGVGGAPAAGGVGGAPAAGGVGGAPADSGPGSPAESDRLKASSQAWSDWLAANKATAENYKALWQETTLSVANSFADGFADVITSGKSFGSMIMGVMSGVASALISQSIKTAIATIGIQESVTASKAAAAAPHPFLIPLFVGLALAAFASAIGKTKGAAKVGAGVSGGGGGGTSSSIESDVGSTVDLTVNLTGGTKVLTPEEQAQQIVDVTQEVLLATGGNLGRVKVVTEEI